MIAIPIGTTVFTKYGYVSLRVLISTWCIGVKIGALLTTSYYFLSFGNPL